MLRRTIIHALAAAAALSIAGTPLLAVAADGDVVIWHYWDGANADAFDAAVAAYAAANPGVSITAMNVPNGEFLTKLQASAQSNTLPTIAIGDLVWVPQVAEIGTLADLRPLLPQSVVDDINPALTGFGSIGGKLVTVPVSANNLSYMYNKTLYTEAGLDPNAPPATWEDLIAQGKIIKEKTGKPAYELFTQAGDNGEGLTWNFQVNLWQAGGEFLNADNSAAAFNTDAGKKTLSFWKQLIDEGISPLAQWGVFEKGGAAAAQEGSWMVGIWAGDPPFDFGVGAAPHPADGKPATNLGGEQAMVFDNNAASSKAAADFLAWFLSPAQVTAWSETTGMIPVTKSVASSADYLGWVDANQPRLKPYVEQMAIAHARPNTPLYPKVSLAFAKQIERALRGEIGVDEALAAAETDVNAVLKGGA
jgi:multiple sugar transport system substrate-binding protein